MVVSDDELSRYYKSFKESESKDPDFVQERNDKKRFFQETLSRNNIDSLEEGDVHEIIRNMWSFQIWTNLDYVAEKMIDGDIEDFKRKLKDALYNCSDKCESYEKLIGNVSMVGPASASEILTCVFPEQCGIWNRKARMGLDILSYSDELPVNKKKISGKEYQKFNEVLKEIQNKLEKMGKEVEDFLELDYLLYEIVETHEEKQEDKKKAEDFDHDEMIKTIEEIGDGLGFDVKTEYPAGPGARLDVKWSTKVANLGSIGYAFEVQRRGNRDSAIINLQQAKKADPTIQKLVIVSTEDQIDKFKEKINTLDENFRKFVSYVTVEKIEEASEKLRDLKEILQEAGLMDKRSNI